MQPFGDTDPVSTDFPVPRTHRTDVSKSLQGQHEALAGLCLRSCFLRLFPVNFPNSLTLVHVHASQQFVCNEPLKEHCDELRVVSLWWARPALAQQRQFHHTCS